MKILRHDSSKVIFFLVFFSFLGLYFWTLAPSVASQGDSGELVTVAYLLGIAHPPGYPLFTMLGHLFTWLPFNSVAWRVNFFSAVVHAITLALVYLTVEEVTKNRKAAFFASIILGLSYTFWLYSLIAEVFALNDLFIVLIIYLAIRVYVHPTFWQRRLLILTFVFALALTNHHSIVLLLPALIYFLGGRYWRLLIGLDWRKRLTLLAGLVLAVLGGLLPYLYIVVRAKTATMAVAWSYPTALSDFLRFLLRMDYGTFAPYQGANPSLATIGQKIEQLRNYWQFVSDDFLILPVVLAVFGFVFGLMTKRKIAIFLLLNFLMGIFFLVYSNFPFREFSGTTLQILERFYLFPNIILVLFLGLGLSGLFALFNRTPVLRLLIFPLMAIFIFVLLVRNYPLVNQKDNFLALNLGKNMLTNAPKKSLFTPLGDVPTFLAMYARYVENYRTDVEILTANQTLVNNDYKYLKLVRPDLDFSMPAAASVGGVIIKNKEKVRVTIFGSNSYALPNMTASPSGFLFEFADNDKLVSFQSWEKQVRENLSQYEMLTASTLPRNPTIGDRVSLGIYSGMFATLGMYCANFGLWSCAVDYYSLAHIYDSSVVPIQESLAIALSKTGQCQNSEKILERLVEADPNRSSLYFGLMTNARECFGDETSASEYEKIKSRLEKKSSDQSKFNLRNF